MKKGGKEFLSLLVLAPAAILLMIQTEAVHRCCKAFRDLSGVMYYTHPAINYLPETFMGFELGAVRFATVSLALFAVWLITKNTGNGFLRKILY